MATLETVSGKIIDPENLDVTQIDINDIAWSLSRINRFSGHTVTEVPYNVAQHSVFVAEMILKEYDRKIALFGLLHDAAESYIGDIPSPIKKIPALKAVIDPIEDALLNEVFKKYCSCVPTRDEWRIIKYYDKKAQFIESFSFMASRGLQWPGRNDYNISLVELQNFHTPISSIQAYQQFINKFNGLANV